MYEGEEHHFGNLESSRPCLHEFRPRVDFSSGAWLLNPTFCTPMYKSSSGRRGGMEFLSVQ